MGSRKLKLKGLFGALQMIQIKGLLPLKMTMKRNKGSEEGLSAKKLVK